MQTRAKRTVFEQQVWSECRNGEDGVLGSRASQARITLTVLRAFRIGKKKRLFCSLVERERAWEKAWMKGQ